MICLRRFYLTRSEDLSGISGTGVVAEGVELTSGKIILTWLTTHHSIALYDNIKELVAVHGHEGRTKVVFIDDEAGHERPEPNLQSNGPDPQAVESTPGHEVGPSPDKPVT